MVNLLLDANISYRAIKKIATLYPDSIHVSQTGLQQPAADNTIWEWAKANDFVIVTNDSDFVDILTFRGFPPKIVLLKMGNNTTNIVYWQILPNLDYWKFFNN